ncbi:hypothetical protein TraAM80_09920, partial [Trypanosoma rangeli]
GLFGVPGPPAIPLGPSPSLARPRARDRTPAGGRAFPTKAAPHAASCLAPYEHQNGFARAFRFFCMRGFAAAQQKKPGGPRARRKTHRPNAGAAGQGVGENIAPLPRPSATSPKRSSKSLVSGLGASLVPPPGWGG